MQNLQGTSLWRLVQVAHDAMRAGRMDEAVRAWEQVHALAPAHPQALFHLGRYALHRKNPARARDLLEQAVNADPGVAVIALNLSYAYRDLGDALREMDALVRTLAIDPYYYPALLAKGMLLERGGETRKAALVYKDLLKIVPPDSEIPPELQEPLAHARDVVRENAMALERLLGSRLDEIRHHHANEKLDRFDECVDIVLGKKKVYTQEPSMLLYPHLPAVQFYDAAQFPWIAALEAASGDIREEFFALIDQDTPGFRPYVDHPAGSPLNQWRELNHSPRWSAYFLWDNGVRIDDHCRRCPRTTKAVEAAPLCDIPGFAPTVFFSILKPGTRIPPHTGVTNTRLVVHLPLVVPEACGFRVGNETRPWQPGRAWVFDDTIEHEAWNDSDKLRVVLIVDIWNPYLSATERELVTALLDGVRSYYGN